MDLPNTTGHVLLSRWGMGRVERLPAFLVEAERLTRPVLGLWTYDAGLAKAKDIDAVAGWGHKPTAARARNIARKHGLPYLAVEDGFLRSCGLGVEGAPPLSLVVDRTGIYYDAQGASDLETMLENASFDDALLERASRAMQWLKHEKLSKYNTGLAPYDGPAVRRLIVDQTEGDASVLLSGAAPDAFGRMIADALRLYPAEDIAVKLHPDTMAGRRGSYLRDLSHRHGIRLLDRDYNPWDLLAATDEVATISSLFGFEALMAGKRVHCYGMPFYAGWGATHDLFACPRRTRQRGVTEIFAAAYILYARYVDPFTGKPAELEDVIGILSDRVRHARATADLRNVRAVGFSPWKMGFIPKFTGGRKRFTRRAGEGGQTQIVWGLKQEDLPPPVIRIEDGFVRSRGLGANLVRPWSLVIDRQGIYFDPRRPSGLETLLQTAALPEGQIRRARRLRAMLVENEVSKYNTGRAAAAELESLKTAAAGRTVVLVPGQVEDDASIRAGTLPGLQTNLDLLKAVRAAAPGAFILYKPHPDVEAGKRKGAIPPADALLYADALAPFVSVSALWPYVDEVHTLTSLTGFEGLLRGKAVHAYGLPFYAGWGLTNDRHPHERRTRRLTLDELIACALILYPVYYDWKSGQICNIETVIHRLSEKDC